MAWFGVPLTLFGFEGLSLSQAILGGLRSIAGYIIQGLEFIYFMLLRYISWAARNPEAAITMGAVLWALLT